MCGCCQMAGCCLAGDYQDCQRCLIGCCEWNVPFTCDYYQETTIVGDCLAGREVSRQLGFEKTALNWRLWMCAPGFYEQFKFRHVTSTVDRRRQKWSDSGRKLPFCSSWMTVCLQSYFLVWIVNSEGRRFLTKPWHRRLSVYFRAVQKIIFLQCSKFLEWFTLWVLTAIEFMLSCLWDDCITVKPYLIVVSFW